MLHNRGGVNILVTQQMETLYKMDQNLCVENVEKSFHTGGVWFSTYILHMKVKFLNVINAITKQNLSIIWIDTLRFFIKELCIIAHSVTIDLVGA